jgi:hypothetical protein
MYTYIDTSINITYRENQDRADLENYHKKRMQISC